MGVRVSQASAALRRSRLHETDGGESGRGAVIGKGPARRVATAPVTDIFSLAARRRRPRLPAKSIRGTSGTSVRREGSAADMLGTTSAPLALGSLAPPVPV